MNLPYDRETMIAYFDEGKCPYCGKGRYKKIMAHISMAHEVDIIKLKDELLISRTKGFCDEELHDTISNRSKNNIHLREYDGKRKTTCTDTTRKKLSHNVSKGILNNPTEIERRKNLCRLRTFEERQKISAKSRKTRFGSELGFTEQYKAMFCKKYVDSCSTYKDSRKAFDDLEHIYKITYYGCQSMLRKLKVQGYITWEIRGNSKKGKFNVTLTDKSLNILNGIIA